MKSFEKCKIARSPLGLTFFSIETGFEISGMAISYTALAIILTAIYLKSSF